MVILDVYRNDRGLINAYKVSGHAAYAVNGQDICCSAVSALTQAPILGLETYLGRELRRSIDEEQGILEVELATTPDDISQAILETMVLGVKAIASQFPKKILIREHRR